MSTLAQSRFDWERVLRELAIVIPNDVWLTSLNATGLAGCGHVERQLVASSGSSAGSDSITGPSLEIQGCAGGHEAVARFLAALHDIDGVTRVAVMSSERPDQSSAARRPPPPVRGLGGERGVLQSQLRLPVRARRGLRRASRSTRRPGGRRRPRPDDADSGSSTTTAGDQSQVADANQQLQQQKDSAAQKTAKGRKAVDTFIPGAGSAP